MRLLPILVLCITATGAKAQFLSGNDLYAHCGRPDSLVSAFVAGVASKAIIDKKRVDDVRSGLANPNVPISERAVKVELLRDLRDILEPYCMPRKVSIGQLGDVFCAYLKDNPARRTDPSARLAESAFAEAWPCKAPAIAE
jgi:hypothetical protein